MHLKKLTTKITRSYKSFLQAKVRNIDFCFVFRVPKISVKGNENLINAFQKELKSLCNKNEGLKLNTVSTRKGTIVESLEFGTEKAYLQYLGKIREYQKFCKNIDIILKYPQKKLKYSLFFS